MIGLLAATAILFGQNGEANVYVIREPDGKPGRLMFSVPIDRMPQPKLSPKKFGDPPAQWQFDWIVSAYGLDPTGLTEQKKLRFRVYSQQHKSEGDKAPMVARMAIRLWDLNGKRLKIYHNQAVNDGIVDFYLCWGGEPGGEQLFDSEVNGNGVLTTVNTIYIYQLPSFKEPIEMAREVAHEYGHASLPPVGGFQTPEDWANGFLGEKLYLRWLRNEIAAQRMYPDDAMMSDAGALDRWVKQNVDPLVMRAATNPPNPAFMNDKGKAAMDLYLGLALYMESILPNKVFARSLKLIGSTKAGDYPAGIVSAVAEQENVTLAVPPMLKDKDMWVPVGKGKVTGATIVKRQGDWALIRPLAGGIVITTKQ